MLTALIQSCAERGITFTYGLHLPSTFQVAHAFQQDVKAVAANLARLLAVGCSAFAVVFADGDSTNAPIAEGGKNLGVLHAEALNALVDLLRTEPVAKQSVAKLQFFVAPAHRHGDLQYEKTLPKKHLYYWRDINTNLHPDAAILFEGAEQLNERVSHNFAAAVWQYWGPKRKVVFWDKYVVVIVDRDFVNASVDTLRMTLRLRRCSCNRTKGALLASRITSTYRLSSSFLSIFFESSIYRNM